MTTSPQSASEYEFLTADPDPLLAAIPGLLGFAPEQSLVLLAFTDRPLSFTDRPDADRASLTATMRLDLDLSGDRELPTEEMRGHLADIGRIVTGYETVGTVAVRIDDAAGPGSPELWRPFFRIVDRALGPAGGLSAGFALRATETGTPWYHCFSPVLPVPPLLAPPEPSGLLSDPQLSPVALKRAVYSGRQVLARRSDIAGQLTGLPHCDENPCRARIPQVPPAPPGEADARRCRLVLDRVRRGPEGLGCAQLDELAEALSSVHTRDLLMALSLTELRDRAEDLWVTLCRRLRGRPGAAAATLLGHLHYMAGAGAYAGAALNRALDLDGDYHLAQLLDTALLHGLRPADLADLVEFSRSLADDLGVELPPQTRRPAG